MTTPKLAVDVGRTIDEGGWGAYQRWLIFLAALTIIFDGIDNQLLGVTIPSILAEWRVPRSAFSPVVSLGYMGMMIGGAVAGAAGDRFGRRDSLLASMLVFGAATLAVSTAGGVNTLAVLRFVAGLGLGGALPNAAALAAEYVPVSRRAIAVTLTIVCVPFGATLAGLIAIPALPAFGWRTLFVLGGCVPTVAAVVLYWLLPESPRYLARRPERWSELRDLMRRMGHQVGADASFQADDRTDKGSTRAPFATIVSAGLRRDSFALWAAFFSCLLSVYMAFSWLPSILVSAGLGASVASTGISVFNLGGVVGAVSGGFLIARFGSRPTMLTIAALAVGGAVALSLMSITAQTPVLEILLMLAFTGGMINAAQTTMFALAANVYSTAIRATGVGMAVSIGRLGAILSGYAGPWALDLGGSRAFFGLMAVALCVTFVALAIVKRHVEAR